MPQKNQKVVFIVMDGWGLYKDYPGNAISLAKKPFYDQLWQTRPVATLEVSGESVGLPQGQMGTSEVNHFTIGAGKVVFQDLVRINRSIDDGSFENNPAFLSSFEHVKKNGSALHLMGLLSDGGVHSHINHFKALLKTAKKHGINNVYIHVFTDGRDTSPNSSPRFIQELEAEMQTLGIGSIASVVGRYYAMDRDKNWDRTNLAFKLLTQAEGEVFSEATKAVQASYQQKVTDEFIKPCAIKPSSGVSHTIEDGDGVIFVNFRNDRPRQLTEVFLKHGFNNLHFTTMAQYNPHYDVEVAFPLEKITMSLGKALSEAGKRQLRITETEKFAHMTFFLNCKHEDVYEGEDRIMFDSYSDIATHDQRPEMRAGDIADEIVANIQLGKHDVIFSNLCNPDMVGHTGNIPATIKAVEAVDSALAKIVPVAEKHGYAVMITADHGNADQMLDEETGEVITSHSLNPVPFILVSSEYKELKRRHGTLVDFAPTILAILGLEVPDEMTGESFV